MIEVGLLKAGALLSPQAETLFVCVCGRAGVCVVVYAFVCARVDRMTGRYESSLPPSPASEGTTNV